METCLLTVAMGKRLIAQGLAAHPAVQTALREGTVVVVAGTTNAAVAGELLRGLGQEFNPAGFRRGLSLPPGATPPKFQPPKDVVIRKGVWEKDTDIFTVAAGLGLTDLVFKGANAVDVARGRAAVLVGHPQVGTSLPILEAVVGRRARLIVPVGLEKRVTGDLDDLARRLNAPTSRGARLLPLPGEVFTEIDALRVLHGIEARLVSAGGVLGAEGGIWLGLEGPEPSLADARDRLKALAGEAAQPL